MCLAVPGKVVSMAGEDPLGRMGKIDFGGVFRDASLAYVPEAKVGDYVIIHAGFALSVLDEEEARQVLDDFRQIDALNEIEEGLG
jgi:hydrogenase expression/formation protein HypC